jgi:hypothetical protein
MKSLNSIKYILLAFIVLGFFANFAQNDYGFDIAAFSLLGLLLIFIAETIYYAIKEEPRLTKERRKKKLKILFAIFISISIFLMSQLNTNSSFFWILLFFILTFVCILIVLFSLNKPMLLESISLLIFSIGFIFKSLHLIGSGVIIVISCVSLAANYITQSVIKFRLIKNANLSLAFWVLCFFLIVILSVLGLMFKMMHWPGAGVISILIYCLFIMFVIRVSIRRKFKCDEQKVTLWNKIIVIKGNIVLLFLFFTLAALWGLGTTMKIVPGIYSDSNPQAMQRLWAEGNIRKGDIYWENWINFLENREKSMNNEQ